MDHTAVTTHYLDDDIAQNYDAVRFAGPVGRLFDLLEQRTLMRAMQAASRHNPSPRILDVPCGTGRITRLWLEMGLQVTGGDISPAMIRVAERRCKTFSDAVDFQQMDLDQPLPGAGQYDIVTCIRLLHHLESADRQRVLSRLAESSRRFVIVNLPYSSPYYRTRRRLKRLLRQGVSRTSATWSQIRSEVNAAGLTIVFSRFMLPLVSENLVLLLARR